MRFASSSGAYTVHLYDAAIGHAPHDAIHQYGSPAAASCDLQVVQVLRLMESPC